MFRPRVPTLERQIIVLTPMENRSKKWLPIVKEFLKRSNCEIVITTPHEHDTYMSIVQGLTHFSYISLASTIKKLNINIKRSRSFSSPVYSLMLDMASRIVCQNPYLYYSIQKNNKKTAYTRETLIKESIYLSNLIEEGDEEDFVKKVIESAEHLDEREEALIRSDKAISRLTQKANILTKSMGKQVGHSQGASSGWNNVKKQEHLNLSVLLPSKCDEKYLIKMFKNIEPVIDVELVDVEDEDNDSMKKFTFNYTLFDKSDESYVEEYINCIGGTLA